MKLKLKKVTHLELNAQRKKWREDPRISRYFQTKQPPQKDSSKIVRSEYFEIHYEKKLVGDIKVFSTEKESASSCAQMTILIGEPVEKGIGTAAIGELVEQLSGRYEYIYCLVNRYNIASIKMLQRNHFKIEDFRGNEVRLRRNL